jgi:hypothetical protein
MKFSFPNDGHTEATNKQQSAKNSIKTCCCFCQIGTQPIAPANLPHSPSQVLPSIKLRLHFYDAQSIQYYVASPFRRLDVLRQLSNNNQPKK